MPAKPTTSSPGAPEIAGTVRTLKPEIRDLVEARMRALVAGIAAAHGARIDLAYNRNYPVTRNHPAPRPRLPPTVAGEIVGRESVDADAPPVMGGEDFSYMLERGRGLSCSSATATAPGLHNPAYDFNDEAIADRLLLLGPAGRAGDARVIAAREVVSAFGSYGARIDNNPRPGDGFNEANVEAAE